MTLVGIIGLAFYGGPVTLGMSSETINGQYYVAGGTHPLALAISAALITIYVLLIHQEPIVLRGALPEAVRRFVAFWVDFIFAMLAMIPILGIVPALVEWRRTGEFLWHFERTTSAASDDWLFPVMMIVAASMLILYFAVPVKRGKPTPGACLMGYQIVVDDGATMKLRRAVLRASVGFIALSAWPVTALIGRDRKNGKLWIDTLFRTHAVKFG
jgi:uncharacterized RDD family membrane protein YckC